MGEFNRISRILKSISLLIQSYAALRSIKHMNNGEDEIFIARCKINIASVVDLLQRKPNWELDIIVSYAVLILDITNAVITLEQVAIIDRPL